MKKSLSFLFFIAIFHFVNAQVSMITSKFSQNLTKSDLPFSGDRKLYAVGIDDKNTENYFVVSKNRSGADRDELFIEKFTKKGNEFIKSFQYKLTHPINKSLAFIDNRASYSDVDKDGNYESLSLIDQHQSGPESKVEKVIGMILYQNTAYEVWISAEDEFSQNHFSANFSKLPVAVKEHFLKFWDGLNKIK
ncbi:hypothetical protein [Kaistella antarctica]|uniref:Uncharacterized protein n=1 Tax=Kaistella antarctica TaxID=266748 RepID=A0A448NPF2_9FLAO|nr:hypothetical protein [Kaistella antarctica]KEY19445.1 hypothetical protein HY04_13690 [Kaistella antarctica]SEW07089.1 hypothetical protein SAMN05421765_2184 [Kaistella antarctica]VEH97463.1 Uncharacterised protein [Kaistella antarctica]